MSIQFSIIIPTYNRGHLICATIDSVLKQRYRGFEIIIIDDGSSDNTEGIIHSTYDHTPEVRYIKQPNAERGAARNFGVTVAKGDYINFFDSDDLMLSNHLEEAKKFLETDKPEAFHLNYEIHNVENKVIAKGPKGLESANASLIKGNFLCCNGMMIRRDIARSNPFEEDRTLAGMEDWELWLRLAAQYKIHLVEVTTSVLINHDERSVLQTIKEKLILRVLTLIDLVLKNQQVSRYYRDSIPKFKASCYTYISLHITLTGKDRLVALKFLWMGIREDFSCLFTQRFLAIVKHLLW